jgi:NAD(P)-dependent dehydrogenase (short-subunit alcohol dehydrogenase family)
MERRIRVNAVAPGPVSTPLIPASFPAEHVAQFGQKTFLGRPNRTRSRRAIFSSPRTTLYA